MDVKVEPKHAWVEEPIIVESEGKMMPRPCMHIKDVRGGFVNIYWREYEEIKGFLLDLLEQVEKCIALCHDAEKKGVKKWSLKK